MFDRLILVPAPDHDTRVKIFEVHTRDMPLKKVNIKELAKKTEGYSGADIEGLCREAGIIALRENIDAKEIKMDCFNRAMDVIHSSLDEQTIKYYELISKELQGGIDKRKKSDTGVGYYS